MTSTNTVTRSWAVTVDPDRSHQVYPWPTGDTLAFLQYHVHGLVERVPIGRAMDMWVNEEFIYTGMEPNPLATVIAWDAVPARINTQFYCGPTVFTGTVDVEGNTLGLSDDETAFTAGLMIELGRCDPGLAEVVTNLALRWLAAYR